MITPEMIDRAHALEMLDRVHALVEQGIFSSIMVTHNVGDMTRSPLEVTMEIEVNDGTNTSLTTCDPRILDVFITYYEQFNK